MSRQQTIWPALLFPLLIFFYDYLTYQAVPLPVESYLPYQFALNAFIWLVFILFILHIANSHSTVNTGIVLGWLLFSLAVVALHFWGQWPEHLIRFHRPLMSTSLKTASSYLGVLLFRYLI